MSTFNAINLAPKDEQVEAEEHTRELQVEEGFKLYERALSDMNNNKFELANEKFEQLFDLDILKLNKWGLYNNRSPTLDRLRYLSYRNRAMYYYFYIVENYNEESMDSAEIVNDVLKIMENLIESLQHSDADSTVTSLLVKIFQSFKSKKLERLALEYELNKSENEMLLLGRRKYSGILPPLAKMVTQYQDLIANIKDKESKDNSTNSRTMFKIHNLLPQNEFIDKKFQNSLNKIFKMKGEDEVVMKKLDITEVELDEPTWECFAKSLKRELPYVKLANLLGRNSDPYSEIEFPIEGMTFKIKTDTEQKSNGNADNRSEYQSGESPATTTPLPVPSVVLGSRNPPEINVIEGSEISESEKSETTSTKRTNETLSTLKPRSSKRFKERDTADSQTSSTGEDKTHALFFMELDIIMTRLECKIPINYSDLYFKESDLSSSISSIYPDIYTCLKTWNSWHTDIFQRNDRMINKTPSSNDGEVFDFSSLFKSDSSIDKADVRRKLSSIPNDELTAILPKINESSRHFHEIRFTLLEYLLNQNKQKRFVVDYVWSEDLYKIVLTMVLTVETNLFDYITNGIHDKWGLGLSVYEILVNLFLQLTEEMESKNCHKNKIADLRTQRNKLERKISRLYTLLISHECSQDQQILIKWVYYLLLQATKDYSEKSSVQVLSDLVELHCKRSHPLIMEYPNYEYIQRLDTDKLSLQLKKINAIESFTVINPELDSQENENMRKLEGLLSHDLSEDIDPNDIVDQDMINYVKEAPFAVKIKLWDILFTYYLTKKEANSLKRIYMNMNRIILRNLKSQKQGSVDTEERQSHVLSLMSMLGNLTEKITIFLEQSYWNIKDIVVSKEDIEALLETFFVFYPVLYFESNHQQMGSSSFFERVRKSSARLKDHITAVISFLIYASDIFSREKNIETDGSTIIELIESYHRLLGSLSSCDSLNQLFLDISEKTLCKYITNNSYNELKPILWCRYHFSTTSDSFLTKPHKTKERNMDKTASLMLGIYFLKLQYQDINPLLYMGNKNIVKQIFDTVIETVGEVSFSEKYVIYRNHYLLKEFLNQPITISLIKKALNGCLQIKFSSPKDELQEAMDTGIFYVASIQALNQYVQRKKLMQARPSELDFIVKNITTDILYNTSRAESWYILGLCYSYIVEDDLTWTSDKLESKEKKNTIAVTQRKALLCFLMALSLITAKQQSNSDDKFILKMILECLGKELTIAHYKPMSNICFYWADDNHVLGMDDMLELKDKVVTSSLMISDFNIQQLILLCFTRVGKLIEEISTANNKEVKSWESHYHIAKLLFKYNRKESVNTILENIQTACNNASSNSDNKDPIIEPQYSLLTMCYKLVIDKIITIKNAIDIIEKNKFLRDLLDTFPVLNPGSQNPDEPKQLADDSSLEKTDTKQFCTTVVKLLEQLTQLDKKRWHHRPQYRVARIIFSQNDDCKGALKIMEKFISAANNKGLINIWKPDHERPGKHFVYGYQYVLFYVDLLQRNGDFSSIAMIIRKLRRFGSSMLNVNDAVDYSIKSYIKCAYRMLEVDDKFIETCLPNLNYLEFQTISENIIKNFEPSKYTDEDCKALKLAYQLKKSSNGITFDGPCLALYIKKFYVPTLEAKDNNANEVLPETTPIILTAPSPDQNESPPHSNGGDAAKNTQAKKRVSKKEAFDRIKVLTSKIPSI